MDNLSSRSFQETPRISTGIHSAGASMSEKPLRFVKPASSPGRQPRRESIDPRRGRMSGWTISSSVGLSATEHAIPGDDADEHRRPEDHRERLGVVDDTVVTTLLVELPDDEPPLPLVPAVVVAAGGESAVMVIPCVSDWSTGGSLARALLMLRAKLRTPPA